VLSKSGRHRNPSTWAGKLAAMRRAPDKIPENMDFAAQELLKARADERAAMLENIAKALTRHLLKDEPGIGAREISGRVAAFVKAVRVRLV
jgi:hypothetical protein